MVLSSIMPDAGPERMAHGAIPGVEKSTIYLDEDLRRRLRAESRRTGRPQAVLIRDALRAQLGSRESALPSFAGAFVGGGDAAVDKRRYRTRWQAELSKGPA
jgi:Ribbon-helix-helix protein, copG family